MSAVSPLPPLPASSSVERPDRLLSNPQTLRRAWHLIIPFWLSAQKSKAYALLLVLLIQTFLVTYIAVWFNTWHGRFMDALAQYDKAAIWQLITQFAFTAVVAIVVGVVGLLANSTLQISWRKWLTDNFLERWFANEALYRIEREQSVDNPDQRIAEDIELLITHTCNLGLGLVATLASLVSFSIILWQMSGALTFSFLQREWAIPGYMFWFALVYALFTSALIHWIGYRLMYLEFNKQRAEADFRFMLAQVREHAEQIALYRGAKTESQRMKQGFEAVRENFWQIVRFNLRFEPVNTLLRYLSLIIGMAVVLPRYFAQAVTLGGMMQLSNAFGFVYSNLAWFINQYKTLQQYRVVVARLDGLEQAFINAAQRPQSLQSLKSVQSLQRSISPSALDSPSSSSSVDLCDSLNAVLGAPHASYIDETIAYTVSSSPYIEVNKLSLKTPAGHILISDLNFVFKPGNAYLIQGPAGIGKSTLMRALAGIWPYGSGQINIPANAQLLFLSQKNYVPAGTLKAALCYPANANIFSDQQCQQALYDCYLDSYSEQLEEVARWGQRLSPGEQQCLAISRALLHRSDYLFLDESMSAVDTLREKNLYEALFKQLPNAAIISVSHRVPIDILPTHIINISKLNG